MVCRSCGTNNERGFKFCVKCGSNLENPQEVNYEQVDMGGYHTEEEFSDNKSGFTFGSGTFVIRDTAPSNAASDMYTADELNESDEEFDFSMYDEPYIPKLDTDRVSLPSNQQMNRNQAMPQMMNMPSNQQMNRNQAMPQMMNMPANQQMNRNQAMPQMMNMPANQQMNRNQAMPQMMNMPANQQMNRNQAMPQMMNMPANQQMNRNQTMPSQMNIQNQQAYGQSAMYGQPQIVGYDQSGMPIYGQPMMYGQPQITGYDRNGMPVYGQPQQLKQNQNTSAIPQLAPLSEPEPAKKSEPETKKKSGEDFWDFFDGGKPKKHDDSADDFFGKSSHKNSSDMGDLSTDGLDFSKLKRNEKKKNDYMGDTPLVDASKLRRNDADKFNKFYMKPSKPKNRKNNRT